jgi:hypothetical protein
MSDDEKITRLPIDYNTQSGDDAPGLKVIRSAPGKGCDHRSYYVKGRGLVPVTYYLREGETEVECGHRHTRVDPMFVLQIMAGEETQWSRARGRYVEEMTRLHKRSRTKCRHCGRMTEISKR